MPVVRLTVEQVGSVIRAVPPAGPTFDVPCPRFRCLLRLPGLTLPKDAIVDTGAPLTWVPERVWGPMRVGVDYGWLPFAAGTPPPAGRIGSWVFAFRLAPFLAPVGVMDYATEVERPDVVAAFTTGNPPANRSINALPPVVVGLWGGLLEGGKVAVGRDPVTGRVVGQLEYP